MVDVRSLKHTTRSTAGDKSFDQVFPGQDDPEAILTARGRRHANEHKVKKPAHKAKKPRKIDLYRECKICAEDKRGLFFPKRPLCPSTCSSVCKPCYQRYISEKFLTSTVPVDWSDLTCLECHLPLLPLTKVDIPDDPVDIPDDPVDASYDPAANNLRPTAAAATLTSILPKPFFTRPNKILAFRANQSHPAFRFCPSPTCTWGQINRPNAGEVPCVECGFRYCATHLIPWHTGYTCARYEDSHPGAAVKQSSEERIKKVGKQCPGVGCGWVVEKDGGCGHMQCARCGLHWTWDDVKFLGEAEVVATKDTGGEVQNGGQETVQQQPP